MIFPLVVLLSSVLISGSQACSSATSLIESAEGYRDKVYTDTTGHKTICWGFNIDSGGSRMSQCGMNKQAILNGQAATKQQCECLLTSEVNTATSNAASIFGDQCSCVQAVLVDMTYNLGSAGMRSFTTFISLIKSHQWSAAANDLSGTLWCKQVGNHCSRNRGIISKGCNGASQDTKSTTKSSGGGSSSASSGSGGSGGKSTGGSGKSGSGSGKSGSGSGSGSKTTKAHTTPLTKVGTGSTSGHFSSSSSSSIYNPTSDSPATSNDNMASSPGASGEPTGYTAQPSSEPTQQTEEPIPSSDEPAQANTQASDNSADFYSEGNDYTGGSSSGSDTDYGDYGLADAAPASSSGGGSQPSTSSNGGLTGEDTTIIAATVSSVLGAMMLIAAVILIVGHIRSPSEHNRAGFQKLGTAENVYDVEQGGASGATSAASTSAQPVLTLEEVAATAAGPSESSVPYVSYVEE